MKFTLRPYQNQIVEQVRDAYRAGFKAPLLQSPTASGKTVIFAYITEQAAKLGNKVMILVHRQELLQQTSRALFDMKVPHGLIAPRYSVSHDNIQVASVQTLVRRIGKYQEPDLIIIDECFPAGTLVDGKPIESFRLGDIIKAYDHNRNEIVESRVSKIFRNPVKELCKIKFSNGKELICTPNHPIYSPEKACYIPAISLYSNMMVINTTEMGIHVETQTTSKNLQGMSERVHGYLCKSNMLRRMSSYSAIKAKKTAYNNEMRRMPKRCYLRGQKRQIQSYTWQGVLLRRMQKEISVKTLQQNDGRNESKICIRTYEEKQSNEKFRDKKESLNKTQSNGMETTSSRRKRSLDNSSKITFMCARMGNGSCNKNKKGSAFRLSKLLQSRRGRTLIKNRDRSRRNFSFFNKGTRKRQEKNRISGINRVESVEVLEQGSDGKFAGLCQDGYTYNIEVYKYNNYFANGILVHNCHHTAAGSWQKILSAFPNSRLLGVTATPVRLDGKGLGKQSGGFFDTLINGLSVADLIDMGYLSKPVIYAPPVQLDMSSIHKQYGDFKQSEVDELMDKPTITGCAVEHYKKLCPGEPAIAFCASVKHAKHVAEQFNAVGISAESIDGKLDDITRKNRIDDLANGRIKVLTSCEIISEGTDIPVVSVGILLRPTASTGLFLQQCGRILRIHPSKTRSIILDHVGNTMRHGFPDDEREWTLKGRDKKTRKKDEDDIELNIVQCQSCYMMFRRADKICPECGWVVPVMSREIDQVDGELVEIERERVRISSRREVGMAKTEDELNAIAAARGYKKGWVYMMLKARAKKGVVNA